MPNAKDGRWVRFCICLAACLCGCSHAEPPPYAQWASHEPDVTPSGSFAVYVRDAVVTERIASGSASRVYFTPGMKRDLVKALAPVLSDVARAGKGAREFAFRSRDPFEAPEHHRGWWMIGQAFSWRIEDQVVKENYDQAIGDCVAATRFGFGLTGGSAIDASLGLTIVDKARQALVPALPRLSAAQLQSLADGMSEALQNRPPMSAAVHNERLNMLRAVQKVQDLYRDQRLKELTDKLGPDVSDAVAYLERMRPKDAKQRPAYFQGFAAEAEAIGSYLDRLSTLNAEERAKEPEPRLAESRPWWRFAKHFFGAGKPLFDIKDATLARTRLMVLEALVLKQIKVSGVAPADLHAISESLAVDPFNGRPFVYRAEGSDFRLYSVGADLKDDGGETNESFSTPDLTVEK